MSLLEIFHALEYSSLLIAMRSSPWLFPVIATIHLFGLAMIGGAVLVFNLRLLGVGLVNQSPRELARQTIPLLLAGVTVMLVTGPFLFMCFATKYYYLSPFWIKLVAFTFVLSLTFAVRRVLEDADGERFVLVWRIPLAATSLLLWFSVALGGRLIGFP